MKLLLSIILCCFSKLALSTVEIIVPFSPGGTTDIFARASQIQLSSALNLNSIVINKTGANGKIGIDFASQKAPDGKTLLVTGAGTVVFNRVLYTNSDTNIFDFDIIPIIKTPMAVVVSNQSGITTINELVNESHRRPINCGTSAPTTTFFAKLFIKKLNLSNVELIPYKGSGDVAAAIAGGSIDCAFDALPTFVQFHLGGKVRIIGLAVSKKMPGLENIEPISNFIPGLDFYTWFGIGIRKDTPNSIKQPILNVYKNLYKNKTFKNNLENLSFIVEAPPANPARWLEQEYQRIEDLRQSAGIEKIAQ